MSSTQPSMAKWQHLPIYARRALQLLEDNISDIEEIVAFNEGLAADSTTIRRNQQCNSNSPFL